MSKSTLVFDLETKRLASEVGGWSHIAKLGLAAAVLYHVETEEFIRFSESDHENLINLLVEADEVIGYNIRRFDYEVLRPYGIPIGNKLIAKTTDLMVHIQNALGFRLRLDNLVEATLGEKKSADGVKSVEWYKAGELEKVLDYCEQDVQVTFKLWSFGKTHRKVYYLDKFNNQRIVQINW